MKVSDVAIFVGSTRTALTVNLLRLEVLRPIQCDQQMTIPLLISLQVPPAHQSRIDLEKHVKQSHRCHFIQQIADLCGTRNLSNPKQTLGVVFAPPTLHLTLMLQERFTLHEEHRKRPHNHIAQLVARRITQLSRVGNLLNRDTEVVQQHCKTEGQGFHVSALAEKPLSSPQFSLLSKFEFGIAGFTVT